MIVPVMAISNLVLTQQIYSEETNGAHAYYREPVPLRWKFVMIRITTDIGVVIVTKWRHYLFNLEPYFSSLRTVLTKSVRALSIFFGMFLWFLWLEILLKLDNLDVRPLSVVNEALLKYNFTLNLFEKVCER